MDGEVFTKHQWNEIVTKLDLAPQQAKIVQHIFKGDGDKRIATEMNISLPTVRTHISRIFSKYQIQGRHELILYIVKSFYHDCQKYDCPRQKFWGNGTGKKIRSGIFTLLFSEMTFFFFREGSVGFM